MQLKIIISIMPEAVSNHLATVKASESGQPALRADTAGQTSCAPDAIGTFRPNVAYPHLP